MSEIFSKYVTFFPLDSGSPKLFGFSEFFTGLALMVLVWTIADERYHFRIRTTSFPLQGLSFGLVAIIGILSLLTDLWRANQWLVPQGNVISPSDWQAILGGSLLFTFLIWIWVAFISPPLYGRRNAKRYAQALYKAILKGYPSELSVVADELMRSVRPLIHYASDRAGKKFLPKTEQQIAKRTKRQSKVTSYADDILLLIADRRFCRTLVESSPGTALSIFREIGVTKKYGVQIDTFANNLVNEAINNKDSFLFHEEDGYKSGLMGYHKPLSHAMFSNFKMVEEIGTLLDPDLNYMYKWDARQWQTYCRLVLLTLKDYVESGNGVHSFVLHRAKGHIEYAAYDLYKINGATVWGGDEDVRERLRVVVHFINDAIEILDKKGVPQHLRMRIRGKHGRRGETIYDYLAEMIVKIIDHASAVKSPQDLCWWIQHNEVWGELFNFNKGDKTAAKVVQFKVRRLLFDEITSLSKAPNVKSARILGYCLNVLGLRISEKEYFRDSLALQIAVLAWTRKNYASLRSYNQRIGDACLVDGITFEEDKLRLVKTYPADGLRRKPAFCYLDVEPPTAGSDMVD